MDQVTLWILPQVVLHHRLKLYCTQNDQNSKEILAVLSAVGLSSRYRDVPSFAHLSPTGSYRGVIMIGLCPSGPSPAVHPHFFQTTSLPKPLNEF